MHLGAEVPLARPWYAASAHGDGKGNHDFPVPTQEPSDEPAAAVLASTAGTSRADGRGHDSLYDASDDYTDTD